MLLNAERCFKNNLTPNNIQEIALVTLSVTVSNA